MITNPLVFHISPQWKQSNTNSPINKQQKLTVKHLCKSKSLDTWLNQSSFDLHNDYNKNSQDNSRLTHLSQTSKEIKDPFIKSNLYIKNDRQSLTINLNKGENNNENIKTTKDLNQILGDIQTYRNQLYDTRGSIHIQVYSAESKQCCCNHKHSTEICKQISKFENELFQNDLVEYVYKIECITNKNTILK